MPIWERKLGLGAIVALFPGCYLGAPSEDLADRGRGNGNAEGQEKLCGDLKCSPFEDCESCPEDCGVCPSTCGDDSCDPGEDCMSCEPDCGACPSTCGDDSCDPGC